MPFKGTIYDGKVYLGGLLSIGKLSFNLNLRAKFFRPDPDFSDFKDKCFLS